MTTLRMIVLTCDGPDCEAEASEGAWFTSVPEAVTHATRAGWVRITRQGKVTDLCPEHAPDAPRHIRHQIHPDNGCPGCRALYERTAASTYRRRQCPRTDAHLVHHWTHRWNTGPETFYCAGVAVKEIPAGA